MNWLLVFVPIVVAIEHVGPRPTHGFFLPRVWPLSQSLRLL
jgi:hypothetical protein